uniref:Transmembrane protein 107 n=1 Tax=Anas platyrhynchos TaxID=8839 RepID=A0A8B9R800_ANAPL
EPGPAWLVPGLPLSVCARLGEWAALFREHLEVRASLPLEFSAEEYAVMNAKLLCALGLATVLLAMEFGGFFMGVSMFHRRQGLFSLGIHAAASISLGLALMDGWDLGGFWLLLGLCSAFPAITVLLLLPAALGPPPPRPFKSSP